MFRGQCNGIEPIWPCLPTPMSRNSGLNRGVDSNNPGSIRPDHPGGVSEQVRKNGS